MLVNVRQSKKTSKIEKFELEKLWKQGFIAGLFNIPFENVELF